MPNTSIQPLPYPDGSSAPAGPTQIKALAEAVEGRLVMRFASTAERDAKIPSGQRTPGMMCYVEADNGVYVWVSGSPTGAWALVWLNRQSGITPATGYTSSRAIASQDADTVMLAGALVSSGAASIGTTFVHIGTLPSWAAPPSTPTLPPSRFFTVGVFGSSVLQLQVLGTGVINARSLTGTVSLVSGTAIYLDGIAYRVG